MFEKEAEEYALKKWEGQIPWGIIQEAFQDGAEYGYNKKCDETFELALSQIKHDREVVIEENERLRKLMNGTIREKENCQEKKKS